MNDSERAEKLRVINEAFIGLVPHNAALSLEVVDFGPGVAVMRLPYQDHLIGNPHTGVLHGGVVTTLIDACCGAAVYMKLTEHVPIATLDLRIDYLAAAPARRDLFARAECFKLTRNVAFVRAIAYCDLDAPVASASGTFMVTSS